MVYIFAKIFYKSCRKTANNPLQKNITMEKETLVSNLKTKAATDNLSDRSYEEVAELFLAQFADDSKVTDESWDIPVKMLKTMSGQLRHDLSAGVNDYKTKFEAESQKKQETAIADAIAAAKAKWLEEQAGKKTPPTEDVDSKIAKSVDEALSSLTSENGAIGKLGKQFETLMTQIAAEKKAQTEETLREDIRQYLLGRGVDEEDPALYYTMKDLVIGDNPDLATLKNKAEKDYENNYKRIHRGEGGKPFGGGSAGGSGEETQAAEWLKGRTSINKMEAEAAEARKKLLK